MWNNRIKNIFSTVPTTIISSRDVNISHPLRHRLRHIIPNHSNIPQIITRNSSSNSPYSNIARSSSQVHSIDVQAQRNYINPIPIASKFVSTTRISMAIMWAALIHRWVMLRFIFSCCFIQKRIRLAEFFMIYSGFSYPECVHRAERKFTISTREFSV